MTDVALDPIGWPDSVAAWRQTLDAVIAIGDTLSPEQWQAPTECPGWTVKDVFAHLVGGELWMSVGHPYPAEGLDAISAIPVADRRDAEPAAVLAELRAVSALRRRQLSDSPPDPDAPTRTAFGAPVTVATLLSHRTFDAWVHEQDIRRAVGRPGNLATASAHLSAGVLTRSLPWAMAKRAGAPPGTVVRLRVTGPVTFEHLVTVDERGRGHLQPADAATGPDTVRLDLDWETFSRLAAGRIARSAATVAITGDHELAERILAEFAITP